MAETLSVVSAEQFADLTTRIDQRFDDMRRQVNQRFDGMQRQFDDMRQRVGQRFDLTHESIHPRSEVADKRFDDLCRTMADIRQTLVEMRAESHAGMLQLRRWLIGLCVGSVVAIGVALLK